MLPKPHIHSVLAVLVIVTSCIAVVLLVVLVSAGVWLWMKRGKKVTLFRYDDKTSSVQLAAPLEDRQATISD